MGVSRSVLSGQAECLDVSGAVDHWKKALSIYEALGDGKRAGALHLRLGDYYTGVSNRGEAYAHSLEAVELLESEGESPELAQAYALVGWYAAHGFGEKTIAIPMLERALCRLKGSRIRRQQSASPGAWATCWSTIRGKSAAVLDYSGEAARKQAGSVTSLCSAMQQAVYPVSTPICGMQMRHSIGQSSPNSLLSRQGPSDSS